jgi:predicted transposase
MNPGMPKGATPKPYLGVQARSVFLRKEDGQSVPDLMRRFSTTARFACNRLLGGKNRKELKREDGPPCVLFGLNTRYAGGGIEKAQAALDSAKGFGHNPQKVVFREKALFLLSSFPGQSGQKASPRSSPRSRKGPPMEGTPSASIVGGSLEWAYSFPFSGSRHRKTSLPLSLPYTSLGYLQDRGRGRR